MGTVAERLVCGMAATAKTDGGASRQSVRLSFGIHDFKIAFDANGSVVIDSDFRCRHFFSSAGEFAV
jgi:hypothetical protein